MVLFEENLWREVCNGDDTFFLEILVVRGTWPYRIGFKGFLNCLKISGRQCLHVFLRLGEDGEAWKLCRRLLVWEEDQVGECRNLRYNVSLQVDIDAGIWI